MIANIRKKIQEDQVKFKLYTEEHVLLVKKLQEVKDTLQASIDAQLFLQNVAKDTQSLIRCRIETIVNTAIHSIFGGKYTFKLSFEIARNKTEANIVLLQNGKEVDPLESTGGGVCAILSYTLQIILLLLSGAPRVLVVDQLFGDISEKYKPLAYSVMSQLSKEMGIQVIAVSHDKHMIHIADAVFTTELQTIEGFERSMIWRSR
jgi:hypothetical protein